MVDGEPEAVRPPTRPALPVMTPGEGFSFLSGFRILDLSNSIAGPYAAMLLGDFGADVVKVEAPAAGDDARAWGPPFHEGESLWYLSVNRNKRSVALDYNQPAGLEVVRELIGGSDAVIVNKPRRSLGRLGLGPEEVLAANPRVVYVAITGFGLEGERADWPCYDLIAEGYSGVMDLTGERGGGPQKVGAPAADMLAGADAAYAAVAALLRRERGGSGGIIIDVSLVDSMTRFLSCRIVPFLGSGEVPARSGGTDSVIAIYQAFHTADQPITLGLGNDGIWRRFWEAVGEPYVASDPRYKSNALRRARREEIVERIQAILLTKPRAEWLATFTASRIPTGPINRIDELVADTALQERGMFFNLATANSFIPQVGTGIQVDGKYNEPRLPPPPLGAHSRHVLKEWLGMDERRLKELERQKTVWR